MHEFEDQTEPDLEKCHSSKMMDQVVMFILSFAYLEVLELAFSEVDRFKMSDIGMIRTVGH